MADKTLKFGSIAVTVPAHLVPPPEAGNMSPEQVKRIPKAPRDVGKLCELAAQCIERAGAQFQLPTGLTAASLREAGAAADGIDTILHDLETTLTRFKQANLLRDAEADKRARLVNDQIKAQSKQKPELRVLFKPFLDTYGATRRQRKPSGPSRPGGPGES